jgi:D-3-phosphoglycerate dehydrogenase / 2-oxoglutarate reductase
MDAVDTLVLDLLEWVGPTSRPYPEVMEAWRSSCPRLPVWERANERGLINRHYEPGRGAVIAVSTCGLEYLHNHRNSPAQTSSPTGQSVRIRRLSASDGLD